MDIAVKALLALHKSMLPPVMFILDQKEKQLRGVHSSQCVHGALTRIVRRPRRTDQSNIHRYII